ncbi:hypothetical protein WUBG_05433 [Wuchereria bancrofti]|uniref:Uncharacterized protein n=1 Tax=Wuchereria bancrofti TaxID=6293 RepID=J9F2G8_WUCBA|nr:hypothetical protein WUBG_05433 [Wuchereria bancrofti]
MTPKKRATVRWIVERLPFYNSVLPYPAHHFTKQRTQYHLQPLQPTPSTTLLMAEHPPILPTLTRKTPLSQLLENDPGQRTNGREGKSREAGYKCHIPPTATHLTFKHALQPIPTLLTTNTLADMCSRPYAHTQYTVSWRVSNLLLHTANSKKYHIVMICPQG